MTTSCIVVSPIIFSTEQIKKINKGILKYITDKSGEPADWRADDAEKKAKVNVVPCSPLVEYLHPFITGIRTMNKEYFGYNLYFYLDGETFNYNVYEGKTKDTYDWHIDAAPENWPTDFKLTCLLNLSEDTYEGGDFLIFPNYRDPEKEEYKNLVGQFRAPGTAIIFNSFMPHKVLPVTKGKRITLTYWAEGPTWK